VLTLVTPAAVEPVTLLEAKAQLRLDTDDENDLIHSLIVAVRDYAETFTHRAFITQIWDLKLDGVPSDGVIRLPKAPLQSLPTPPVLNYVDTAGATQTWASTNYTVVAPSGPQAARGYIVPAYGVTWPSVRDVPQSVTVRFYAGYGLTAASVPAGIKAAIKLMVAHLWSNREAVSAVNLVEVPMGINALLWPYKSF